MERGNFIIIHFFKLAKVIAARYREIEGGEKRKIATPPDVLLLFIILSFCLAGPCDIQPVLRTANCIYELNSPPEATCRFSYCEIGLLLSARPLHISRGRGEKVQKS